MNVTPTHEPGRTGKLLGIAGIIGGLALIVAFVPAIPWDGDVFNLRLLLFNAGAIAVSVGLVRRRALASRVALATAFPVIAANAWYPILVLGVVSLPGEPGPGDYGSWFPVATTALWLAGAWFGFAVWRLGLGPRPAAAALGIGSILAWTGFDRLGLVSGDFAAFFGPLALLGILLNGLAWIGLGIHVASARREDLAPGVV